MPARMPRTTEFSAQRPSTRPTTRTRTCVAAFFARPPLGGFFCGMMTEGRA